MDRHIGHCGILLLNSKLGGTGVKGLILIRWRIIDKQCAAIIGSFERESNLESDRTRKRWRYEIECVDPVRLHAAQRLDGNRGKPRGSRDQFRYRGVRRHKWRRRRSHSSSAYEQDGNADRADEVCRRAHDRRGSEPRTSATSDASAAFRANSTSEFSITTTTQRTGAKRLATRISIAARAALKPRKRCGLSSQALQRKFTRRCWPMRRLKSSSASD